MSVDPFHILAALAAVIALPTLILRPRYVVLFFLSLVVFFSLPSWGLAHGVTVFNLYSKGTGVLPVSLFTLFLWGLFLASIVLWRGSPAVAACQARRYFWAFNLLFAAYVIAGALFGVPIVKSISSMGVINLFNMTLLTLILLRAFPTAAQLEQLTRVFVFLVFLRGAWLVVRYLFLGGDPANAYANLQGINVKLTSYDIADLMLACMVAAYAAWQLTWNWQTFRGSTRFLYLTILAVELFVVVFSFRRAAWLGLVLAGLLITLRQPWRRRVQVFVASAAVAVFAFGVAVYWRFSSVSRGGYAGTLFYDLTVKGKISVTEGRFSELALAFETISENLLLGVGPWGGFGPQSSLEFMHSGPLHIWLKVGLAGLLLFLAILGSFVLFYRSGRRLLPPQQLGMYEAGFAGFLFLIPHMLVGSLLIESRTLLVLGIALALPYLVYTAHRNSAPAPTAAPVRTRKLLVDPLLRPALHAKSAD